MIVLLFARLRLRTTRECSTSDAPADASAEVFAASRAETGAALARTASPAAGSDTPLPQPLGQERARLRQPAGEPAFGDGQPHGRVPAGEVVEFAQDV
jgi:hypothetical protein